MPAAFHVLPETPRNNFWVTAYTDASFRGDTGVASWAVWLRCPEGRFKKADVCPSKVINSFQAEYYSILQGIKLAIEQYNPEGVLVVNDCDAAIRATWPWSSAPDGVLSFRKEIDCIRDNGLELRTKFVKGHAGGRTVPSWLNEWCDKACKEARRKAEAIA